MGGYISKGKTILHFNLRTDKDTLIAMGQSNYFEERLNVHSFELALHQEKLLAHLVLRKGSSVISLGEGQIMLVGGDFNNVMSCYAEVFYCQQRQSTPVSPLNLARSHHSACAVDKQVLVCGGHGSDALAVTSCELYSHKRWTFMPDLMEERCEPAIASSPDRRIFVTGGYRWKPGYFHMSSVECCRMPIDSVPERRSRGFWNNLAPMREERAGHSAVFYRGYLIVAGGGKGSGNLTSVEILSTYNESSEWVSLSTSMKEHRSNFSLLCSCNGIIAVGNSWSPYNSMEKLPLKGIDDMVETPTSNDVFEEVVFAMWESLGCISSTNTILYAVMISKSELRIIC